MTIQKARSNSVISVATVANRITFKVEGVGETVLDLTKVHADNIAAAAIHGFIQRIRDAAAISRDDETGQSADPQDKLLAMQELVEHYESGTAEWRLAGGARGPREGGLFVEALMKLRPGTTREKAQEFIKSRSPDEVKTLKNSLPVIEAMNEIRAKRAGATSEKAEELLKGL